MEFDEILEIMKDACAKYKFELYAPVRMSNRLSRVLGRVTYRSDNGMLEVKAIEFSGKQFPTKSYKIQKQIVLHETAHYIAFLLTNESHAHDGLFREICKKIGCTMTGEIISEDSEHVEIHYKYDCICSECGRHIRYYKRMPSALNRKISYCCGEKLDLIQLY